MKKFITILLSALCLILVSSCEKEYYYYGTPEDAKPESEKLTNTGLLEKLAGNWETSKIEVTRKERVWLVNQYIETTRTEEMTDFAYKVEVENNRIIFHEIELADDPDNMTGEITIDYNEKTGKLTFSILSYDDDDKEHYNLATVNFVKKK